MTRTILVTGAAGFIGSHVAQRLVERGDRVVALDNLNTYYDPSRKRANLAEVRQRAPEGAFTFVEGDIRDRALVGDLFSRHGFHAVAHLAAMAGVRVSVENPYLYFDVNQNGTLVLLDAAQRHGGVPLVCASTSSVYGNTQTIPFVETDACDKPLAPYSASKRAMELLGYSYHHLYQLDVTMLRFFTVYGPRGRPDMMAYKVLDNIFNGVEVPMYNGGHMHRDWTYIDDIVSGVVAALDTRLGFQIINLGRGEPVLLADFVRIIEDLTGRQAHLTSAAMPDTDIPYTCANIERAQSFLAYRPTVSVGEGVSRLWEWYQTAVLPDRT